ncbi:hypothetical protein CC86DRAFT_390058 [Ophiobolus disseminans]|uniref:Heterokaryon incompatibility domain-containing protein n=1 Tax=Ophiobolus disseminans TaxID=1469910 RepID=A0A6A7ANB1_9PLEO|nr:hypothetical protein CC86DRAFT_390058 [Ophiobolus disseminans]
MRMAQIYNKAEGVFLWLGEEDLTSNAAIELVTDIYDQKFQWTGTWWQDFGFTALSQLLERSWFRRGWVLQEAAFSTNSMIQCGDSQVYMDHFGMALDSIRARIISEPTFLDLETNRLYIGVLANFMDSPAVRMLDMIEGAFTKSEEGVIIEHMMSLETLVHLGTFSETSNERDAIYALLNMAKDTTTLSQSHQSHTILPDYRKDKLPYGDPALRSKHRLHGNPLVGINQKRIYNAHNRTKPSITCLSLLGTISRKPHSRHINLPDSIWRTLCANRDDRGDPAPRSYRVAMLDLLQKHLQIAATDTTMSLLEHMTSIDIEELLETVIPEHVKKYLVVVRDVIWNRRTFRTSSSNLVGLIPQNARVGDHICVLYGCSVPVVLRQHQDPDGGIFWKLVGDAYAHGVMDGDILRQVSENWIESNETEFELR